MMLRPDNSLTRLLPPSILHLTMVLQGTEDNVEASLKPVMGHLGESWIASLCVHLIVRSHM